VLNYRPFFILGQVNSPGSYPYASGLNVRQAVAVAGGFTRRAKHSEAILVRESEEGPRRYRATLNALVLPGDTIEIERRLF
jgi:polysaccharide export outer membrane protein